MFRNREEEEIELNGKTKNEVQPSEKTDVEASGIPKILKKSQKDSEEMKF